MGPAVAATTLRARLGTAAPPGLLEAAASLQDLACHGAPPGERDRRIAALEDLQRYLRPAIVTAKNGPYLVRRRRRHRGGLLARTR